MIMFAYVILCSLLGISRATFPSIGNIVPDVSIVPNIVPNISSVPNIVPNISSVPNIVPNISDVPGASIVSNHVPFIPQNKCIEDLGCFYTGEPFFHLLHRPISLPPTDNLKTKYWLYTPSNPQDPEFLELTPESIRNSSYNSNYPLKVLIHGFRTQLDEEDIRFKIKDALLISNNYNVIIIDWSKNNGLPYSQAAANTRVVGAQAAKLLKMIMNTTGLSPADIHVIGHSLGGQMAGYIGERIPGMGRITGLDPAGPSFQYNDNRVRLDPTDALFVDVIHSDGGENVIDGLGISDAVGHMDFFPNGGERQPGCTYTSDSDTYFGGIVNVTTKRPLNVCDHNRANEYFLESINSTQCRFLAVWCNSYADYERGDCLPQNSTMAEMGLYAKKIPGVPVRSKFFLRTSDGENKPFCIQQSVYLKNENDK